MSKTNDKLVEIVEYLSKGYPSELVAALCDVPIEWVYSEPVRELLTAVTDARLSEFAQKTLPYMR